MKFRYLILWFLLVSTSTYTQQLGKISITFSSPDFANKTFYIAGYYGKYNVLLDSVKANTEGKIYFSKNSLYTPGIYMLVDNDKNMVSEFIMDKKQEFSIAFKNELNAVPVRVINSPVNEAFFTFNSLLKNTDQKQKKLLQKLASSKTHKDSVAIQNEIWASKRKIEEFKKNYIREYPNDVLSLSFKLSSSPESYLTRISRTDNLQTKSDTLTFIKNIFLKDIDFNDERLLQTPFLENRLLTYFNTFVPKTPEAITNEINEILNSIDDRNSNTFSYLSLFFANQYLSPDIMGLDKVFVNIYERYFKEANYDWLKIEQKLSLQYSYLSLKDNLIGHKARNLFMTSIDGQQLNLFDIKAPYILLIFWDPSCGHCKKELPKVKKVYDESLKSLGVKIYAVNINPELDREGKNFIEQENLQNWIHVHPSSVVYGNYSKEDIDFQTLFNVTQTPVLYLLDKDKIFRAKKLPIEKYPSLIKQLEKVAN